jgi:mRNA-degrading endonuclease RelE of RelBE toxin-antitoxin system
MMWNVKITGPAQKGFQRLPHKDQACIKAVLITMETDPLHGDLKRLQGKPSAWRWRVGNYRSLYDLDLDNRQVVIHAILRRTTTTYE